MYIQISSPVWMPRSQSEQSLMNIVLCNIGIIVAPAYLALTAVALLSTLLPFLKELASHGKTRKGADGAAAVQDGQQRHSNGLNRNSTQDSQSMVYFWSRWWNTFLHGEAFLVNKRYFIHFYLAGLVSLAFFVLSNTQQCSRSEGGLLVGIHLMRRCYECLRVHRYSERSKMHLAGYVCGLFHYIFLPFMLFDVACGTNSNDSNVSVDCSIPTKKHYLFCLILCLWGQFEQFQHHLLLSSLRPSKTMTEPEHKIPRGRLFQYVSCPHYLAEITIYVSFAWMFHEFSSQSDEMSSCRVERLCTIDLLPVLLKQQYPTSFLLILRGWRHVILLFWVGSNLTVTAVRSHRWYLETFPTYHTLKRKAIFPWIL